jgi:6-phospho-3-hexuloisomerase
LFVLEHLGDHLLKIRDITTVKDEQRRKTTPLGTLFEDSTFLLFDSIVPIIMNKLGQSEASLRRRHAIWV